MSPIPLERSQTVSGPSLKRALVTLLLMCCPALPSPGQQLVQRGALGKPAQVLDDTRTWSTPLFLTSDHDVEMYIPDVSNPDWLARNYPDFENKGQYVLSMFTFYRTPRACRANQVAWGFSDAAHADACLNIGYRVRQGLVDVNQRTVTLQMAAMLDQNGQVISDSIERRSVTRAWSDMDANTQAALRKANDIIELQMKVYDSRQKHQH